MIPPSAGIPLNPVGAVQAYRTIAAAYGQLRNGKADWMLLKRGDVWQEALGTWKKSGLDLEHPMLVSTYGSGDRPKLETGSSEGLASGVGSAPEVNNVAFVGVHLHANTYSGSGNPNGMRWMSRTTNLLIEDCKFEGYSSNLVVQGYFGEIVNFRLRRSVIVDAFSTDSHAQGLYITEARDILIEENVFDHNGWREGVPGAEETIYNHNIYMSGGNEGTIVIRGNIFANGSNEGVKMRSGGDCIDNLLVRNSIGITHGYAPGPVGIPAGGVYGTIANNVVLEGKDTDDIAVGWGIDVGHCHTVSVTNNIVAHALPGGNRHAYGIHHDFNNNNNAGISQPDDDRQHRLRLASGL